MTTKPRRRYIWWAIGSILVLLLGAGLYFYMLLFGQRQFSAEGHVAIYIRNTDSYSDVIKTLHNAAIVDDTTIFKIAASFAGYKEHVKPGKYDIKNGQSLIDVLRLLRSGRQEEVKVVIRPIIDKQQLAQLAADKLSLSGTILGNMLNDSAYMAHFGFNSETALCMFIPNTYNFYWNTADTTFMQRMHKEYTRFWTAHRKAKADSAGLSPVEVSILASIVDAETSKVDEMPMIAGLYINRLNCKMPLQADPTVKFAIGNPALKRIRSIHTQFPSPYNTYLCVGLPPGPISLPSQQAIDAVLNYRRHNYLFMCAKEDFSGYHVFAATYAEHMLNARRYQLALDKAGIQ